MKLSITLMRCLALAACGMATSPALASDGAPQPQLAVAVPAGFGDLVNDQRAVFDVYMGGVRVAETGATFTSSFLRVDDPTRLVAELPGIAQPDKVAQALAGRLNPNPALSCRSDQHDDCGILRPDVAGVIVDADRYRIDVFVNPTLLTVKAAAARDFLPAPQQGGSLINSVSGVVTGAVGDSARYYVQDNAVLGLGTGRLRTSISVASQMGLQTDTLVAELDRPGLRYSAGTFWLPGNELLGRRKIVGLGLASQTDTRLDRDVFEGTPVIVFLDQRSRIDIVVDGHLVASRMYDAGNQGVDTSGLPEGSYDLLLRITGPSGTTREERRFFSRSRALPALGTDRFMAYGGLMVEDNRGVVGHVGGTPFGQLGWSRRVTASAAVELGAIVTDRQQWLSAGGTLLHRGLRLDTMAMANPHGDLGVFAHLSRTTGGRLTYDLDARTVRAADDRPLLPETRQETTILALSTYSLPSSSYSQASGSVSYNVGQARFTVVGTMRRQDGNTVYSVGPSLQAPILRDENFELLANADFAETNLGRRGFIGLSLRLNRGRAQYSAQGGARLVPQVHGGGQLEQSGRLAATVQRQDVLGAQVQATGSLERQSGTGFASLQTEVRHPLGYASAGLIQPLSGLSDNLQYGFSFGTNLIARDGFLGLSGMSGGDAMVVAKVDGASSEDRFDVLVNEVPLASISGARAVSFPLPSYRAYDVRLKLRGGRLTDYDTRVQRIGLYPGSVAGFAWKLRPLTAVFGRLVMPDGTPVADANVSAGSEIAQTDERGGFLIQLPQGEPLIARLPDGTKCTAVPGDLHSRQGYAAIGELTCTPQ